MNLRDLVTRYLAEGFGRPHPIPRGEKGPRIKGWNDPSVRFEADAFEESDNVGTALTGDLVDVDLDQPEAVKAARRFLPTTARIHGRPGKLTSHYWFRTEGLKAEGFKDISRTDSDGKSRAAMLCEIRTGPSQQTLLPPSIHPSGEQLAWEQDDAPAAVDGPTLRRAVLFTAVVALVVRSWPGSGRHQALLNLAGFLYRQKVDAKEAIEILSEITLQAEGVVWKDCDSAVRSTYAKAEANVKTTGGPSLEEALGKEVVARLRGWFGGPASAVLDPAAPLENARAFVERHHTVKGLRTLQHQSGVFYAFDANTSAYRELDDKAVRAELYRFLDAALVWDPKAETTKPYKPSKSKVEAVFDALQAECNLPAHREAPCWLAHDGDLLPGDILPCANGLLHVPTRTISPATPAFFALNGIDYAFDPQAACPEWERFLQTIWHDDSESIEALQEIFGYLLTPNNSQQKIFNFIGPKRSGKGTMARVGRSLVGRRNCCAPSMSSLGREFGKQALIHKTVAFIADARLSSRTDPAVVAETLLGISGEDSPSVPRKFLPDWHGDLKVRFLLLSNELPKIADPSGALASRFIMLSLKQSFYGREDLGLLARVMREMPGILNWALAGLDRLRQRGHFIQPKSAEQLVELLHDLASPISAFLKDSCEVGQGGEVATAELFQAWCDWCTANGMKHTGTEATFGRDLRAALPWVSYKQRREGNERPRYWQSVRVLRRPDAEADLFEGGGR